MVGGIKVPVVERLGQYTIYLEGLETPPEGIMTFVHCTVLCPWTRQLKKQLEEDFGWLVRSRLQDLYCLRHDKKQEKFIRMFGFEFLYALPQHNTDVYKLETSKWVQQ